MSSSGPFPPVYAPVRNLMLYVTEECNLRCTYCFVDKKARHMSSEVMRRSIDFLLHGNVSGAQYQVHLTFFGGEPFTQLDCIEEAVAYARKPRRNVYKRVEFSATTNGTVVGPRVERIIRDNRMSLLVSVDGGIGAASHRPFVSGRSSYETVARNLPRLVEWSPDVVVRMTFHPQALDLVGNVRHALEMGAPAIALCPVEESDWHSVEDELNAAYDALGDFYISEARKGRILPLEITNQFLRLHHGVTNGAGRPGRPCEVGSSLIGIDVEGNVMPCHRFLYRPQDRIGNVTSDNFDDTRWRYVHLSSADILGCDTCEARDICGGGCRATALTAGHGLYGAHPGYCTTMRAHTRTSRRIYGTLTGEGNEAIVRMLRTPSQRRGGAVAELASR